MAERVLLLFLCISLALAGCKNEPYETGELSIVTLVNKESGGATQTFTYSGGKLSTYSSRSATVNHTMEFFYRGDEIDSVLSDSSTFSFSITRFYYNGSDVTDSTFLFPMDTLSADEDTVIYHIVDTTLVSTRVITYNADETPAKVKTTTWNESIQTDVEVDITWENGNISRLFTTTKTGETVVLKDVIAEYDDKKSIYTKRKEYIYTLPTTKDIFWLSANNPVMFNDGTGEKGYSYSYNRLGYPSAFTSNVGTKYGMTYHQVP